MLIFHIFHYKDYQINNKKAKRFLLLLADNSPNNKNVHLLRKKAQVYSVHYSYLSFAFCFTPAIKTNPSV